MSISSDDDTDNNESDGEIDSELDRDMDLCVEDDAHALDGVDLYGDVHIDRDSNDDEEEDEEEEDKEMVEENNEDEDEDNSKAPRTVGQREMVNTLADNADTMVGDEPTVLPEQGQVMRDNTTQPQPPVPARRPQTTEPPPRPRTLETHTMSGLEFLWLVTPQKPHPAMTTRRDANAAGNTSDIDMELEILCESAGGNNFNNSPLTDVSLPDVPLPNVALPNVAPLMFHSLMPAPMAQWVRSEPVLSLQTRSAFQVEWGSCLVSFLSGKLFISGTN